MKKSLLKDVLEENNSDDGNIKAISADMCCHVLRSGQGLHSKEDERCEECWSRQLFNVHMIVFGSEHVREHRTLLGERAMSMNN